MAAVGVGATVFSYVFWAFGFLRMGTTGLSAQAFGRENHTELALITLRSLVLGVFLGLGLIVLQALLFKASIVLLAPPQKTADLYEIYFDLRIWSAPATLCIYTVSGYLIGTEQATRALYLQLLLNGLNAGLNLLFVIGLGFGIKGIALGSLIAEWATAFVGTALVIRQFTFSASLKHLKTNEFWQTAPFAKLAQTNGFLFLRTLLLLTALAYVTRAAGHISESALAASHILSIFMLLISLGLDGFAYAAEALTGNAYGRRDHGAFMRWCWLTSLWAMGAAIFYSGAFYLFGAEIIGALTSLSEVQAEAQSGLSIMIVLPVLAVASFQFDGIYIGATAAKAMSITMAISFAVFFLVVNPLVTKSGLSGLWGAVLVFMVCRGVTQALYFPRIARELKRVT